MLLFVEQSALLPAPSHSSPPALTSLSLKELFIFFICLSKYIYYLSIDPPRCLKVTSRQHSHMRNLGWGCRAGNDDKVPFTKILVCYIGPFGKCVSINRTSF